MSALYRARFAPSPTGALHLGHARTALVTWLRTRSLSGHLVLRMEDLDAPRVRPGAADRILDDLRFLGLDWDEGPDVGGPDGPYTQSARLSRYEAALARLEESGSIYLCTCTRREIQRVASAPHGGELEQGYPGTCRAGPSHSGRPMSLRFRMDRPYPGFVDNLHGEIEADRFGDDFIVRRADGLFAYQLAVVVDDHEMAITEVVRGDDLLSSTPRQIALYRALGWEPPAFFHLPLLLGPDGNRLAKRHGAISVADHRAAGRSAEQIVGSLAHSLGLLPAGATARPADLVHLFDVARLPREPVTVD